MTIPSMTIPSMMIPSMTYPKSMTKVPGWSVGAIIILDKAKRIRKIVNKPKVCTSRNKKTVWIQIRVQIITKIVNNSHQKRHHLINKILMRMKMEIIKINILVMKKIWI